MPVVVGDMDAWVEVHKVIHRFHDTGEASWDLGHHRTVVVRRRGGIEASKQAGHMAQEEGFAAGGVIAKELDIAVQPCLPGHQAV